HRALVARRHAADAGRGRRIPRRVSVRRDGVLRRVRRRRGWRGDRGARVVAGAVADAGPLLRRPGGIEPRRHGAPREAGRAGEHGVKCPYCGHLGDKVVDSRESKEGEVIRRRRECPDCAKRFTSYERIDEIPYMVVKKDGSRERFERQKLIAGLLKACEKRPVSVAALEA